MALHTRQSLSGFITSDPQLSFTATGDARFYARVGQEQFRREEDGSYTPLEPTFTDLVMFRRSAERAYNQFRKGDNFIAEGEARSYTQNVDGRDVERDQFVASRIGHDNNRTTYTVDRTRPERDTPERDAPSRGGGERAPATGALAARQAAVTPDQPATTSQTTPTRQAVAR
ncbi:MAG: hypothetical protein BGO37_06745 [Cellulomonas sp. 73-92]|uniref:single-stranded DNA-binding protein n=1 Tax=Cellulomonas sp. 73-92 TaxID=1895740 RepID=UPI000929E6DD|nr:single-stranded DNA-binding protein [Cellulomonas sp. 73-92]OJV75931.1 MAG: hypothetical protein BGO37_06745 [Cellulomonas sp. 73-92]